MRREKLKERYKERKAGRNWEKERERFFEERGMGIEETERGKEEGSMGYGDVEKKKIRNCKGKKEGTR